MVEFDSVGYKKCYDRPPKIISSHVRKYLPHKNTSKQVIQFAVMIRIVYKRRPMSVYHVTKITFHS